MPINDPDKAFLIEKQLERLYGKEAIRNPKDIDEDHKEKIKQTVIDNPVKLKKKFLFKNKNRNCEVCNKYCFGVDERYIPVYQTCPDCYIKYVDGREKRWRQGWRPGKQKDE